MADIAVRRVLLVDNTNVDIAAATGRRRIHKPLGWYLTTLPEAGECLEPVDYVGATDLASQDKSITGIQFVDAQVVLSANCAGGNTGPGI
jgi:hypothetical protein